jgi:hypothetical protein
MVIAPFEFHQYYITKYHDALKLLIKFLFMVSLVKSDQEKPKNNIFKEKKFF